MYQYFKRQQVLIVFQNKILIHVDFNLMSFIQLSALVGK